MVLESLKGAPIMMADSCQTANVSFSVWFAFIITLVNEPCGKVHIRALRFVKLVREAVKNIMQNLAFRLVHLKYIFLYRKTMNFFFCLIFLKVYLEFVIISYLLVVIVYYALKNNQINLRYRSYFEMSGKRKFVDINSKNEQSKKIKLRKDEKVSTKMISIEISDCSKSNYLSNEDIESSVTPYVLLDKLVEDVPHYDGMKTNFDEKSVKGTVDILAHDGWVDIDYGAITGEINI